MMDPAPTPPPGAKALGKRSRLLFWLGCTGCLFGLLLLGVGGTFGYLFYHDSSAARDRHQLPVGWRDSLRVGYTLPGAFARLVPVAGPDGPDPATLAPMPVDSAHRGRQTLALRLARGVALQPGDDAILAGALRDTALDRYAAASRLGHYDVMPRLEAVASEADLLLDLNGRLQIRGQQIARGAIGLVLRGEARLRRGNVADARADFQSALALGGLMWRTEPSLWSMFDGRRLMDGGTQGLARVAARTRDSAMTRETSAMAQWLARGNRLWFYTGTDPDTMIQVAGDSTLPRGLRIEALNNLKASSLFSFGGITLGPAGSAGRAARALEHDSDPAVARVALLTDSALVRLKTLHPWGRWRLVTRGSRR